MRKLVKDIALSLYNSNKHFRNTCNTIAKSFLIGNVPSSLNIPTYEGSGQAMHPSVVYTSRKQMGFNYFMGLTPYPFFSDLFENPSLVVSNNGKEWSTHRFISNPVWSPPSGWTCDPCLVLADDGLYLYYVWNPGDGSQKLCRYTLTYKGRIRRAPPTLSLTKKAFRLISPSIIHQDPGFLLYYVSVEDGQRYLKVEKSKDGIDWKNAKVLDMTLPKPFIHWHIEVKRIDDLYLMLLSAHPRNKLPYVDSCLFLAYSVNGVNWERLLDTPILSPATVTTKNKLCRITGIYKSSFLIDANLRKFYIYYSGILQGMVWFTGLIELEDEIFNILECVL